MEKKCLYCGISFYVKPCRFERTKFHSKKCQKLYQQENPMPQETREKISESKGGVKREDRICALCGKEFNVEKWRAKRFCDRKCSMRFTGQQSHTPWNKGLPSDDPRVIQNSQKQAETIKKRYQSGEIKVWNDGLTSETDDRIAKLTAHLTKLRNTDGEWKEKWREAMRKGQVKAWAAGHYNRPITGCEQKTWDFLVSQGYNVKWFKDIAENDLENTWYFQFPFEDAFVPDFACPDKQHIIEVDGCAIHGHDLTKCKSRTTKYGWPKIAEDNQKRDRRKHSMYHRYGWKWANVWECEAELGDFHRIEKYLE